MEQLGFHNVTSNLYSLILTEGPLTVTSAAAKLNKTEQTIQPFVDQLEKLRLVSYDTNKKGKTLLYATNPSIAWIALTADLVWNTTVDLSPIRDLQETRSPDVENLRMLCAEVNQLAQSRYKPHNAVVKHKELDANSVEEYPHYLLYPHFGRFFRTGWKRGLNIHVLLILTR